jgi:hypothetical protein
MAFEVFTKQRQPRSDQPYVTIQRKGVFTLNTAAYESLGDPDAVELLYDREQRRIGFRPATPKSPYAYGVRPNGPTGRSFLVAGRAFLQFYDIPFDLARRWVARYADGMLVIDLNEPGVEVAASRSWRESTPT